MTYRWRPYVLHAVTFYQIPKALGEVWVHNAVDDRVLRAVGVAEQQCEWQGLQVWVISLVRDVGKVQIQVYNIIREPRDGKHYG